VDPYEKISRRRRFFVLCTVGALLLIGTAWFIIAGKLVIGSSANRTVISYVLIALGLALLCLGKYRLKCPYCGRRLPSRPARVCVHCGKLLAKDDIPLPVPEMVERLVNKDVSVNLAVFGKLDRWCRILRWIIAVPALVFGVWLIQGGDGRHLWIGAFAAVVAYMILWYFFLHLPCAILRRIFWITRAKCPNCGTRFDGDVGILPLPGHILAQPTVPEFCSHCGCGFRFIND
jgi:hypothetical protein